jgi:hypothetical protein
MVLLRQTLAQHLQRAQVHGAGCHQRVDGRKLSRQACREEPTIGVTLAHLAAAHTEVEHRRVAELEMEAPLFDLRQVLQELRREIALRAQERADIVEQRFTLNVREVHAAYITCGLGALQDARRAPIAQLIA